MMRAKWLVCLLGLIIAGATQAQTSASQVYLAADGKGGLQILWWVPPERWRDGGFRLEDDRGRVLVERLHPGTNRSATQRLTREDQNEIGRLAQSGNKPNTSMGSAIALGIRALGNWDFAQALGLATELKGLERRATGFFIRGLDHNGKPDGSYLETHPIDLARATPLHTPPAQLRAESDAQGVRLFWQGPEQHLLPVLAYHIERESEGDAATLTPQPLILGTAWPADRSAFADTAPPVETEVRYQVYAIDALGRRSQAASLKLFVPDHSALNPPAGITASAAKEGIGIRWQANASPNTTGYVVERSHLLGGPYEVLTPIGVPSDQTRYRDTPPARSAALYYRVRAVNPRGTVGEPGAATLARQQADAPPAPSGLKAEAGHTRVRLTWDPTPGAFGYQVERRAQGGAWQALGNLLIQEPRLDDHLGPMNGLRLEYRVSAVAWGDVVGPAGKPVVVDTPDTQPPAAPAITGAESDDGAVLLHFHPAAPADQTAQILVLRGGPDDPGLVIGDPLPGDAREWRDTWVLPGETYWYRLVALDTAGNRSDPGEAVSLRVGAALAKAPPQPKARYEAQPFARVVIGFTAPPADHEVVLEARSAGAARWRHVAAAGTGNEMVDAHPHQGKAEYRLRWRSAQGTLGPPSPVVSVTVR